MPPEFGTMCVASATIVGTMLKPVVRESAVPSIVCTKIVWLFRPAANLTL